MGSEQLPRFVGQLVRSPQEASDALAIQENPALGTLVGVAVAGDQPG